MTALDYLLAKAHKQTDGSITVRRDLLKKVKEMRDAEMNPKPKRRWRKGDAG